MDGTVSNEGGKRRLPLWMLGVAAADKVSKSINGDVNNVVIVEEEGLASQCLQPKLKATRTARQQPYKEASEVVESSLLVKCETKRTKGKVSREDASCVGIVQETGFEKRKHGRVQEYAPRKRQKAKSSGFETSEEIELPSPDEDDGNLTMEDLISIAKEFVKDNKNMELQQPSDARQKVESQFADTSSSKNEPGGSLNAPQSNRRSPTHKASASHHNSSENLIGEGVVVNPSMTGDPTQDMLDLFLGPLLKKPLDEKKKKVELTTEDMTFAYESRKQKQKVVLGEEPVHLTKKKSSLKDKVAMFLD